MKVVPFTLLALLLVAIVPNGFLAVPSTVPAFLWSSHYDLISDSGMKDSVNYQIISPKGLAKSVLSEAGWSNFLCNGKESQETLDLALLFIGRELQSSDLSMNKHEYSTLLDLLKLSFTSSNTSMAFPAAFHSVEEYLNKKMEGSRTGKTDLLVFCNGGSQPFNIAEVPQSEGEVLSGLVNSVHKSGAKYAVLYVSDPSRMVLYPSYRELQRFLEESSNTSMTANSTVCDGVCQIKSSLLEGILVGIVLLIILISGLCCMMGIDTPTRFETPQEQ
ncbi:hypothetical protein PIB30_019550 [Stylosanthes scabra]|uniref:V-type proton ATPase subunit S1/VOA1 transmembrane domain-containing protein n=1 Tax=Stylosanthes scabra TaxID=79078 RepID=A0ABU6W7U5_9FABA|nr:hypothetical protein [Stylosanthes scabra]